MEIIHGYCRKVEKRKLGLTAGVQVHGKPTMLGQSGGMEFTLLQHDVPLEIEDDSDKDNNTFKKLQRQLRVDLRPLKGHLVALKGPLTQSAVTVLLILDVPLPQKVWKSREQPSLWNPRTFSLRCPSGSFFRFKGKY